VRHERELKLEPGLPVAVDIEIWPSSTRFFAGETLRVVVKGMDINAYPVDTLNLAPVHHSDRNRGKHVIHTGGGYESFLLVPVVPLQEAAMS
jgi:predicted acyl esterase